MSHHVLRVIAISVLAVGGFAQLAPADVLLDYGIMPVDDQFIGIYSSVSGPDVIGAFDVYQPFTVSDQAGWNVDAVSLFGVGGTGLDVGSTTIEVSLHAWTGSIDRIGPEIAASIVEFPVLGPFDPGVWIDIDFGALTLDAGDYVIAAKPTTDDTWALWHNGDTGPEALVHALRPDIVYPQGTSLATRITGGVVPAPGTLGIMGAMGLGLARRRR
jgi:hypothetical protein